MQFTPAGLPVWFLNVSMKQEQIVYWWIFENDAETLQKVNVQQLHSNTL
jgi:hypothetical protein